MPDKSQAQEYTPSGSLYQARTQFKKNFDHEYLLTKYALHITKNIPLETSFEDESDDIIFFDILCKIC